MTDRRRGTQNVRTILLLMAVATAVYVAALGVYALFELEDPVRALRTGAEALAQEYDTLQVRTAALSRAFDGVEHLSRQTRLTQAQRSLGDSLRNGLEETARQSVGVQANLTLSNIPADMRVAFAEAARSESELAGTLLEALGDVNHGDFEAARASVSRAEANREALVGQLNRAQRLGLMDMAQRQRVVETRADRIIRALTLWLVLGVVLAVLSALFMSRRLFQPLRQLEEGLARVARGDHAASLPARRPDELGRLHAHFNEMTAVLRTRPEVEALRASEVRFRSLIEHGMDLISILAPDGRILYSSPAVVRLLGYAADEMAGRNAFGFVHPEDQTVVGDAFDRALHEARPAIRQEYRIRHKDGSWRVFESVVTNLVDEPTVAGLVVNSRDITDRVEAQEALRKSREDFARIFQLAPVAITLTRLDDGLFVDVNDEFVKLSGYERDEIVGRTSTELQLWAKPQQRRDLMGRVAEEGLLRDYEMDIRAKDGRLLKVRGSFHGVASNDGALLLAAVTDVTERRQAEHRLRESESRFRAAFMTGSDAYMIVVREDGRILEVNDEFETVYGYRRDEAIGRSSLDLDLWASPASRGELLAKLAADGYVRNWEGSARRKDGETFPALFSVTELGPSEPAIVMEVVRDVSEQQRSSEALRKLEEQFRQAQRLEAVGRLAGGVAHDFNNVLTAISGFSDLLLEELPPGDSKREEVEEIARAAQRAATLTRQLLAFSRRQVLQPRVLDLNAVVQTLEKMLPRLLGEDIRVSLKLAPGLGAVRADPGQVEQVIVNLAVNSRDAMPEGGQLSIETANVELDATYANLHPDVVPGPYVALTVTDNGAGMDSETRAHVFEPFFTTKERGKGTGLGLSTVHGIVTQSGGSVAVYSEPGHGTAFNIYLPRVDAPVQGNDAGPGEKAAPGGNEVILLVEDDPGVRRVALQVLSQKGYRVLVAPDANVALAMARTRAGAIHLVLTDLVLPGIQGRQMADRIVAARPDTRVLFMSGYTDDAVVRHGVLEESFPYLQKPFTPRSLAEKVREVLDQD